MLWTYIVKWGWFVSCFEWIVFVCTHTLGKQWKNVQQSVPPIWVQAVMANGFKTPIGAVVILGLHCLPIWLYIQRNKLIDHIFTPCVQAYFTMALSTGRLLCMMVELWFIYNHIQTMAAWDDCALTRPKLVSEDEDDDVSDNNKTYDSVPCNRDIDEVAEEVKPIEAKPRRDKVVRRIRNKGPSVHPTPGSTIIDMGASSQGRRDSSPESQLQQSRQSPGPFRRRLEPEKERSYPQRGRPRERDPLVHPSQPDPRSLRAKDGRPVGVRRPRREYEQVDDNGRAFQRPRRLDTNERMPIPDGLRGRRRSESPGRRFVDGIEYRRRRSESPGVKRRLRKPPNGYGEKGLPIQDGPSISVMRLSRLIEKTKPGRTARSNSKTDGDDVKQIKSKETPEIGGKKTEKEVKDTQIKPDKDDHERNALSPERKSPLNTSHSSHMQTVKHCNNGESQNLTSTIEQMKNSSVDQGIGEKGPPLHRKVHQRLESAETGSIGVESTGALRLEDIDMLLQKQHKKQINFSKGRSSKQKEWEETRTIDINNNLDFESKSLEETNDNQKRKSIFGRKKIKMILDQEGTINEKH